MSIEGLRRIVAENQQKVADLGDWPARARARIDDSLLGRVPTAGKRAPDFDAGIACCLGLIPLERRRLAATLHAAYTEAAVAQVRRETAGEAWDPDGEAVWWLAASAHCDEAGVNEIEFLEQVRAFVADAYVPDFLLAAARRAFDGMRKGFEVRDGVAYSHRDGGMQGAYVAGYDLAVEWAEAYGIYFVGTFRPSLGLEDFPFSDRTDDVGRSMSGLLSAQFAKCLPEELDAVLRVARARLGA